MRWSRKQLIALAIAVVAIIAIASCDQTQETRQESPQVVTTISPSPSEAPNADPSPEAPSEFNSEVGINYNKLRDLLAAGKWQEADQETLAVMLKASGREQEGFLYSDTTPNFPCTDLQTINDLWGQYSNGRFGLNVQEKLWEGLGFEPGAYNYENYYKLAELVGWRANDEWIPYRNLNFSVDAPEGHLPARIVAEEWDVSIRNRSRRIFASIEVLWTSLTARVVKCNVRQ